MKIKSKTGSDRERSYAITGKLLTDVICSGRFVSRVQRAWQITLNTAHEAAFAIGLRLHDGSLRFGAVRGAHEAALYAPGPFDALGRSLFNVSGASLGDEWYARKGSLSLLEFHTHGQGVDIQPSLADFTSLLNHRSSMLVQKGLDHYPVEAIAASPLDSQGCQLDVLFMQEKQRPNPRPTTVKWESTVGEMLSDAVELSISRAARDTHTANVAIADALNQTSWIRAALVSFDCTRQGKRMRHRTGADALQETLNPFSHTARCLPEISR